MWVQSPPQATKVRVVKLVSTRGLANPVLRGVNAELVGSTPTPNVDPNRGLLPTGVGASLGEGVITDSPLLGF